MSVISRPMIFNTFSYVLYIILIIVHYYLIHKNVVLYNKARHYQLCLGTSRYLNESSWFHVLRIILSKLKFSLLFSWRFFFSSVLCELKRLCCLSYFGWGENVSGQWNLPQFLYFKFLFTTFSKIGCQLARKYFCSSLGCFAITAKKID